MYDNLKNITKTTIENFSENNFDRVVIGIRSLYTVDNPKSVHGVYVNYFREFCDDYDVHYEEDMDNIIETQFNDNNIYVEPIHKVIRKISKYTAVHIIEYSNRDACIIIMNFVNNIMDSNHIIYDSTQVYDTNNLSEEYIELDQYFKNIVNQ